MNKAKLILVVCFALALGAGTTIGLLIPHAAAPAQDRSWLTAKLNLTPDQQEKMRRIWSDPNSIASRQLFSERRQALAAERDQAVLALLSPDQRTQYDAIQKDFAGKVDDLVQQRNKAFDETVRKAKEILTPEQAAIYDKLLQEHRDHDHGHDHGPGSGPGGPGGPDGDGPDGPHGPWHHHGAPASMPSTSESTPHSGESL